MRKNDKADKIFLIDLFIFLLTFGKGTYFFTQPS